MANALKNFWTPEETINKMYDRLFAIFSSW